MAHQLLIKPPRSRHRLAFALASVLLAPVALAAGGCLFTDPLNMPPEVRIVTAVSSLWRGQGLTLDALVSDPNGDAVTVRWAYTAACPPGAAAGGDCSACPIDNSYLDRSLWPEQDRWSGVQRSYHLDPADTLAPFCVWAFATDSHGSTRPAAPYRGDPQNQQPVAVINVKRPTGNPASFPLHAEIELSGDGSTDVDDGSGALKFSWAFMEGPGGRPPGSLVDFSSCSQVNSPSSQCFTPDREGEYVVQLEAKDPRGGTHTVVKTLQVDADRLPCIETAVPEPGMLAGYRPDQLVPFAITRVTDDGDWYPDVGTMTNPDRHLTFSWFEGLNSGPPAHTAETFYRHEVRPLRYTLGDRVKVRVEIHDRNVERINKLLAACGDADVCADRPGCPQRVTWTIQY